MPRGLAGVISTGACALSLACGGDGTDPGSYGILLSKATPSGDGQSGAVGSLLPDPLRVLVTRYGVPFVGHPVRWSVLASGGSANPATSTTGADGIASTTITLPPFAATSGVNAIASGNGDALRFNVTSTGATSTATVLVANNEFQPDNLQLRAGGTVSFVWLAGSGPHDVAPVAPNTIPRSDNPPPPATHDAPYSFDTHFPVPGTFTYFCEVHGTATSGMRGSVMVIP